MLVEQMKDLSSEMENKEREKLERERKHKLDEEYLSFIQKFFFGNLEIKFEKILKEIRSLRK